MPLFISTNINENSQIYSMTILQIKIPYKVFGAHFCYHSKFWRHLIAWWKRLVKIDNTTNIYIYLFLRKNNMETTQRVGCSYLGTNTVIE